MRVDSLTSYLSYKRNFIFLLVLVAGPVASMNWNIRSEQIISLANAPYVLASSGNVDEAGRPGLRLRLSFANDCLLSAGLNVRYIEAPEPLPITVFLFQNINNDGCPDIFQPVEQEVLALLPSSFSGRNVRIVARPVIDNSLSEIRLSEHQQNLPNVNHIVEAEPYKTGKSIPPIEIQNVSPISGGYRITGKVAISSDCTIDDSAIISLFEIPDVNGDPLTDAILVTADSECFQTNPAAVEFSIDVESPHELATRSVLMLATPNNSAISLD